MISREAREAFDKRFESDRLAFEQRLRKLGTDIRFRGEQPTVPRLDNGLAIAVDRFKNDAGDWSHLVTVSAGLPPPVEVQGLICTVRRADTNDVVRRAATDRRGQVRLSGLEPIEYRLQVELRPSFLIPAQHRWWIVGELGQSRTSTTRKFLHLQSTDCRPCASLAATTDAPRRLTLEVDVDRETVEDSLIGITLHDRPGKPLATGYVGLRAGLGGRVCGEVALDLLRQPYDFHSWGEEQEEASRAARYEADREEHAQRLGLLQAMEEDRQGIELQLQELSRTSLGKPSSDDSEGQARALRHREGLTRRRVELTASIEQYQVNLRHLYGMTPAGGPPRRLYLTLNPCLPEGGERNLLKQSLQATADAECRKALERALRGQQ